MASCLSEPGDAGGSNGDYTPNYDGYFYYGGGHMQVLGASIGYGDDDTTALTNLSRGSSTTATGCLSRKTCG